MFNNLTKIGQKIIIEGSKSVAISAASVIVATAIMTGSKGVKKLELKDLLK